jgi:hypothetical protein
MCLPSLRFLAADPNRDPGVPIGAISLWRDDTLPDMEPIRQPKTARFVALKLYREELDEFVAMFKKECSTLTISDEKNRYDSLEEMKQHVERPRLKFLDIRGENPGVHFLLNKTEELVAYPGSPPQKVIFNELRTEETTDAMLAAFFGGLIYFGQARVAASAGQLQLRPIEVILLCLAVSVFVIFLITVPTNYITLETRRNSKTFFVKNSEEFAKYAVTATISSLVGALVGYLLNHCPK